MAEGVIEVHYEVLADMLGLTDLKVTLVSVEDEPGSNFLRLRVSASRIPESEGELSELTVQYQQHGAGWKPTPTLMIWKPR